MPTILEPGQTMRLEPPWDTAPAAVSDYIIFLTSNTQVVPDWNHQIISGYLGSDDLVMDVTLLVGSLAPTSTKYRMAVTFAVGYPGGERRYKTIPVWFKRMVNVNIPGFDIVKWNEMIISAVLEPEGLSFYGIEGPIIAKQLRGRIATADTPYLWVDLSNKIWCIAVQRDLPTDPVRWVLFCSKDGARSFEAISVIPIPSEAQHPMGVSQGRDIWIGVSSGIGGTMQITRSREGGETWEEPFDSGAFTHPVPGRLFRNPLSADARFSLFGLGTSSDSGYGFSLDEGRSWEYRTGVYLRIASAAQGWEATNRTHHDWVIGAGNMIGTLFRLSTGASPFRWVWGRSFDDSTSVKVFQIAILNYAVTGFFKAAIKADNTIIVTNGRDHLFFSKSGGQTWFPQ